MNNVDLFNNSFVKNAEENMSEEQKEKYRLIGEEMYNTVDFVNSDGKKQTIPQYMLDAIAYILDSLRSGQHISMLEENEKILLKETYGNDWYKILGYTEDDINSMITFPNFGSETK